jgi:hypothetical protein
VKNRLMCQGKRHVISIFYINLHQLTMTMKDWRSLVTELKDRVIKMESEGALGGLRPPSVRFGEEATREGVVVCE